MLIDRRSLLKSTAVVLAAPRVLRAPDALALIRDAPLNPRRRVP